MIYAATWSRCRMPAVYPTTTGHASVSNRAVPVTVIGSKMGAQSSAQTVWKDMGHNVWREIGVRGMHQFLRLGCQGIRLGCLSPVACASLW